MLSNNVKLLGQMIGNILLPVVAKILPYLNAFVIVLQRLFTWLAKILGINLEGLMGKNPTPDNSAMSDLLDDAEDLTGALDDDTDSAKKLKKQLQGFDALNNLTTNEDKGKDKDLGGLLNDAFLDAVQDYLDAWDKAFKELENKAQALADKIQAFFLRLAKPIIDAWNKVGDTVKMAWYRMGQSLKKTFAHIARDFWRVWEEEETTKIFENLFLILANIAEVVRHLSNAFREAWDYNDNGYRILAGIRDIILIIAEGAKDMSDSVVEWAKNLNLKPLLSQMASFIESMKPVIENLMGVLKDFLDQVLLPLAKWTLEKGLPNLIQVFIDFNNNVDWEKLRERLSEFWKHLEPFAETVGQGLIVFVQDITTAIKDFVNSEKFENFLKAIEEWMDGVSARDVADALKKIAEGIVILKIAVAGFSVLSGAVTVLKTFVDVAKGVKGLGSGFLTASRKIGTGMGIITDKLTGGALTSLGGFKSMMTMDLSTIFGAGTATEIGLTIGAGIIGGIVTAIEGFKFGKWLGEHLFKDDASYYQNFKWFGEGGFFDSAKYFATDMLFKGTGDSERERLKTFFTALKDEIVIETDNMKTSVSTGFEAISTTVGESLDWWVGQYEEFKVIAGAKLIEIISDFVDFKENVKTSIGEMKENVATKLDEMKLKFEEWRNNLSEWKENIKNNIFNSETWRQVFENIRIGASTAWTNFSNWWNNTVVKKINEIVQKIKKAVDEVKKYIAELRREMSQELTFNYHAPTRRNNNNFVRSTTPFSGLYANGGFPEDGIFFANSGELVGKFTNGQTAVANNEQIVAGIQNGVYGAMSESNALLMEQNSLLQAILEKETGISADTLFESVQQSANAYYRRNGRYAFT